MSSNKNNKAEQKGTVDLTIAELKKVVTPKKDEFIKATTMVVFMLILYATSLGFMDFISGKFMSWLLAN